MHELLNSCSEMTRAGAAYHTQPVKVPKAGEPEEPETVAEEH